MSSLMFILLYQIVLVYGDSKHLVRIGRVVFSDKEGDSFGLPYEDYEWCSRHNVCSHFGANLSQMAPTIELCKCSCLREKASTFSIKNGQWQCIDNKEIRERELDGKLVLLLCNMLIYMRQIKTRDIVNISLQIAIYFLNIVLFNVYLFFYLFIYLRTVCMYLFIYLCIYLFIYLFIYLSLNYNKRKFILFTIIYFCGRTSVRAIFFCFVGKSIIEIKANLCNP